MDSPPPPTPRRPEAARIRWGIGDFVWVWIAGIVASVVLASIAYGITGDRSGHPGALTTAFAVGGQFGGWFVALVWVSRAKGRGSLAADFGLRVRAADGWAVGVGVAVELVSLAIVLPLVSLAHNEHQDVVDELLRAGAAKRAVLVVAAILLAPVGEELMFRGVLLRSLRRRLSPALAVAISALAFALAHPLLDPTLGTFAVVPALFAFGALSGVAAVGTGDLSVSILLHVGFNLLTTLSALWG